MINTRTVMTLCGVLFFLLVSGGTSAGLERFLEQGIREYRQENFEEAIGYFVKAREFAPKSPVVAFYLGLTYKQMGNFREAARYYQEAITLVPSVRDAYTELIEVLYRLGELKEAHKWCDQADREGINPGAVSFLRGLILAKEGRNKEAIEAFTRAKEVDKATSQAADFQIAMIHAKERRYKEAQASLKAVMVIDPVSDLATFAKQYESSLARFLEAHRAWRFSLGLSYQYDDNVISKPSAAVGNPLVDGLTGERDSSIIGTFGVTYNPLPFGPWGITAQYQLYTNTYFKSNTHNLFHQALSLAPSYTLPRAVATFPLSYSYILLDGRSYMGLASFKPSLNYQFASNLIGQVFLGIAHRYMLRPVIDPNENRDANIFSGGLGGIYLFREGRGMFNLRYELTRDDAVGRNWVNLGNRFAAVLLLPVMTRASLTISGDVLLQDYQNVHTLTGPGAPPGFPATPEKRQDKIYSASVSYKTDIYKGLHLNVAYNHYRAESNFAIYDYRRNSYAIGLEYEF